MPSRTIRPTQAPAPVPFAYTIGTADGLTPEAVSAAWDGSGAGGDFLPCVSYYSAEGVLLDRAFPDSGAVTAGDTAEVSYRPFKRGGASAALITQSATAFIDPTARIFFNAPLVLTDFGGGTAVLDVTTTAAPPVPFVHMRRQNLVVPTGGVGVAVDFHTIDTFLRTNDVAALAGYQSNVGAQVANAYGWTGDNFRASNSVATTAFRLRTDRPGLYLVEVWLEWRVMGTGGVVTMMVGVPDIAAGQRTYTLNLPFQASFLNDFQWTRPILMPLSGIAPSTDVVVSMFQSTATPNVTGDTSLEVSLYRMSPA